MSSLSKSEHVRGVAKLSVGSLRDGRSMMLNFIVSPMNCKDTAFPPSRRRCAYTSSTKTLGWWSHKPIGIMTLSERFAYVSVVVTIVFLRETCKSFPISTTSCSSRAISRRRTDIFLHRGHDIITPGDYETASSVRRHALVAGLAGWITTTSPYVAASSASVSDDKSALFVRQTDLFAYRFQPPTAFGTTPTSKPLKTHMDEVIFINPDDSKYQYGIVVDPVRINSLSEFGTPEEVAAKVVLSEVNRDGVYDVTLMEDPLTGADDETIVYELNYLSVGKRGNKRYIARFAIANQRLYALTAQCPEDKYDGLKRELLQAVRSFRILAK
jgi:hypothetical protein